MYVEQQIKASKVTVVDTTVLSLSECVKDMDISDKQLFCIIDKYLIPEFVGREEYEFSALWADSKNEEIKSIKLSNGFFNLKESFLDIMSVGYDTSNLLGKPSSPDHRYTYIYLVVKIVATLYRISNITFGKVEYFVITTLLGMNNYTIDETELIDRYNTLHGECKDKKDAKAKIATAVNNLSHYQCVSLTNGEVKLTEKVHFKYI